MQRDKVLAAIFFPLPIVGIAMMAYGIRAELPHPILVAWLVVAMVLVLLSPFVAAHFCSRVQEAATESKREVLSKVDGLAEELEPGKRGSSVHDGTHYQYHYKRGRVNERPSFIVSVPCLSEGDFRVTRETGFDRLAKSLLITCEIQTRDHAFDQDFFLHTDTVGFTSLYFESSEKRQAVREIRKLGFTSIEHDGNEMTARWSSFEVNEDLDPAFVTRAVTQLSILASAMPSYSPRRIFGAPSWKLSRAVVSMIPAVCLVGGSFLYLWRSARYAPLDFGDVLVHFVEYSVAAGLAFSVIALLLIRGRSNSHRELATILLLSLFGFPVAGVAVGIFLNAHLDTSPPSTHVAPIVRKYQTSSGSGTERRSYYYLEVESWRTDREVETLEVYAPEYHKARAGRESAIVVTKAGRFSFEWVVSRQLEDRK